MGLAAFGQTIQLTDLNNGNGAAFISGHNGGILRDDYPLNLPGGQFDPSAESERVIDLIASGPAIGGTIVAGGDYGENIPIQIQATSLDEEVGDPVYVELEASSATATVDYEVNGHQSVLLDRATPGYFNDITFNASIGDIFEISILDQPAATEIQGNVHLVMDLFPNGSRPDLVPTSVTWAADGGVDFSYDVRNSPLTKATTVGLYWADGPDIGDVLGGPIASFPAQSAVGS